MKERDLTHPRVDIEDIPWDGLVDLVNTNQIVPVLGDNLFSVEDEEGNTVKAMDYILSKLVEKYECGKSFDEIEVEIKKVSGVMSLPGQLYRDIDTIIGDKPIMVPESLKKFLNLQHFPVIITTSFFPGISKALGIDKKSEFVYDKSGSRDLKPDTNSGDKVPPSLYYMFGRSCKVMNAYNVTEDDFLDFLHYWQNDDTRPKELCRYLKDKFLLILGCDYPDWVFRFIWHSLREFSSPDTCKVGAAVTVCNPEESLANFFRRCKTFRRDEPIAFLDEFLTHYKSSVKAGLDEANDDTPYYVKSNDPDVFFISYASEDRELALSVARLFESQHVTVWLDKWKLDDDIGSDYDTIIQYNIKHSKRFIPIITNHVKETGRYFRTEWSYAAEVARSFIGSKYVIPIKGEDINANKLELPDFISKVHMLDFTSPDKETRIQQVISEVRNLRRNK